MRTFTHGTIAIGNEPALICTGWAGTSKILVHNKSRRTIYIGGPDVATHGERQGLPVKPRTERQIECDANDSVELYGVAEKPTSITYLI